MNPSSLSAAMSRFCPLIFLATLVGANVLGCRTGALDGSRPQLEDPVKELSPFDQQVAAEKSEPSDTIVSRRDARGIFVATEGTDYPANRFVIWGGFVRKPDGSPNYKSEGAVFNPRTKKWHFLGGKKSPGAVGNYSIGWVAKRLMVVGGESGPVSTSAGARLDIASDEWSVVKEVPGGLPRVDAASLGLGDEFLMWGGCGGCRDAYVWRKSLDGWELMDGKWAGIGSTGFGWTSIRSPKGDAGEMVVFGGSENGTLQAGLIRVKATVDGERNRYDWTTGANVNGPSARKFALVGSLGDKVMIVGGLGATGPLSDGFLFSWASNQWTKLSLPAAVRSWEEISSLVSADGRFVLFGKSSDRPEVQVSVFNPEDGAWTGPADDNAGAPLYAVRPIVADVFNGKVIYWGGERLLSPRYDDGTWWFDVKTTKWSQAKPD